MSALRKIKSYITGQTSDVQQVAAELEGAGVPVSNDPCRSCPDPCDETWHEPYPPRFDVDMESQMLGSVKPYRRQIVISTGKTDWQKEVTEASGTLAAHLSEVAQSSRDGGGRGARAPARALPAGVFDAAQAQRIAILNGSHRSVADAPDAECALVFPDYTLVAEVPPTRGGAQALWAAAVDPALARGGAAVDGGGLRTWVLPYACALTGDEITAFRHALEREGWEVHSELEAPGGPRLEDAADQAARAALVEKELRAAAESKRALVLFNSHVGGHKFSGNVIICTPQGAAVWYGRVSTHEVEAVVAHTVVGGRVLPALLRGGLGVVRRGGETLRDW